jgi:hypothetical protein
MGPDIAAEERRLVEAALGQPLIAGGTFHIVVEEDDFTVVPWLPVEAAIVAVVGEWWYRKRQSGIPAYTFWALAATHLTIVEVAYHPRLSVGPTVARWPLDSVRVTLADLPAVRVDLAVTGLRGDVSAEGSRHDDREREVIQRLRQATRRPRRSR